jgi:hypothetical protein
MARGAYMATTTNVSVANASPVTLMFLNPKASATAASLEILRCWVSQAANATSNQQRVNLHTQVTAFPTLVATATVVTPLGGPNDAASTLTLTTTGAAGTIGSNASAEGAGAKTIILADDFNVLNGWLYVATPPETIVMGAASASGFGISFAAAPTTLTNWSWGVTWREW